MFELSGFYYQSRTRAKLDESVQAGKSAGMEHEAQTPYRCCPYHIEFSKTQGP